MEKTLPQPIAAGRTAEIYPWEPGSILKLYREWAPSDWVDYEARIARQVHQAGMPSPEAGEIIEINGRRGLIYERLDGPSMLQIMSANPLKLLAFARMLAELQVQMHSLSLPGLPPQKGGLERAIRSARDLPEDLRAPALQALERLPSGDRLCHGDYHPDNILMTARGPVIIDWMTAASGSPAADVARTSIMLRGGDASSSSAAKWLLLLARRVYHNAYLSRYRALNPEAAAQVEAWRPVMAAARLNEGIASEKERLIELARGIDENHPVSIS